jgi:hypothetical protein
VVGRKVSQRRLLRADSLTPLPLPPVAKPRPEESVGRRGKTNPVKDPSDEKRANWHRASCAVGAQRVTKVK